MKRSLVGWLFVAPALIHLVVFALGPILYAATLSLYDWNLLKGDSRFVGLQNFTRIWEDGQFAKALINSALYTITSVPLGIALALAVALLVAQKIRGITIFRTIYYLPAVCSQVAIAMIWIYIFLPKKGMINGVLGWFGLPNETDFLSTPGWAMAALVFMSIWVALGPRMVLFVSGILNIPESLYEAAELDGATKNQQFWKVTLPLLTPTTFYVGVTSMISAMQVFTPVYMMTKGGPEGSTDVVGYHIYSAAWERFQIGEASAMSLVLFVIILALSIGPFRAMNKQVEGAA
jgi:multiple sugar transport system permease protein